MRFLNADELEAGLPDILASPKDGGVVSISVEAQRIVPEAISRALDIRSR